MTNYMQASIGRVSFENDHLEESRKGRATHVFGGNSSYYEKELVKKNILSTTHATLLAALFRI